MDPPKTSAESLLPLLKLLQWHLCQLIHLSGNSKQVYPFYLEDSYFEYILNSSETHWPRVKIAMAILSTWLFLSIEICQWEGLCVGYRASWGDVIAVFLSIGIFCCLPVNKWLVNQTKAFYENFILGIVHFLGLERKLTYREFLYAVKDNQN